MLLIRRFEERCAELYSGGRIRGFLHLYVGEEAVATGVCAELGEDDSVVSTYREHGHALARGVPADSADGGDVRQVRPGQPRPRRVDAPVRPHSALRRRQRRGRRWPARWRSAWPSPTGCRARPGLTACFFGDGAVAEGEFHEVAEPRRPLAAAAARSLREQRYAMGTALAKEHGRTDLALRASSYGATAWQVDGMDVRRRAAGRRARRAPQVRGGGGPVFLELRTYRFRAHSMYDPDRYRDKAEIAAWRERDPDRRAGRPAAQRGRVGRRGTRRDGRRGGRARRRSAVDERRRGAGRAGGGPDPLRLLRDRCHGWPRQRPR